MRDGEWRVRLLAGWVEEQRQNRNVGRPKTKTKGEARRRKAALRALGFGLCSLVPVRAELQGGQKESKAANGRVDWARHEHDHGGGRREESEE